MRAVVVNEYGPSEKLTLVDLKEPSPRPDEVLDQARAAHDQSESERTRGKIVLEIE